MEKLSPAQKAYRRRIKFIEKAIGEGAHLKPPQRDSGQRSDSQCRWEKKVNRGLVSNLNPSIGVKDMAELWEMTPQNVSQLGTSLIENLHENCSEETQRKFPIEKIIFRRSRSQNSRRERSMLRGGIASLVKEIVVGQGITDIEKIALVLNVSSKKIRNKEEVLKELWGIELTSENRHISYKKLKEEFKKEKDSKKHQEILDKVPPGSLKEYAKSKKDGTEEQVFYFLGNILRELGFDAKKARLVADMLIESGNIPIRTLPSGKEIKRGGSSYPQVYYVVLSSYREKIENVIRRMEESGRLKRTKIELLCGNPDEVSIPSTYKLQNPEFYQHAGNIIREITGIYIKGPDASRISDFLSGCPVPIFRTKGGGLLFPTDRADKFREFIQGRYKEILDQEQTDQ